MKSPDIIIRIPNVLLSKIKADLLKPHDFAFERVGFTSSTYKLLANGTLIVFLTNYTPVNDEQYINDPEVGARIDSSAIRGSLQKIIDDKVGLFHTHFHTFSNLNPEFSETDLIDNPEIIKSFGYANRDQVHGMLLIGNAGLSALVKIPGDNKLFSATKIVSVGYPMIISTPTKTRNKVKAFEKYERQSFLGKNSQNQLSHVKIGIVGLGGGGSHIVQQLAYLGVKNYVLFDFDYVSESNLNRMVGAISKDVKEKKKKILVAQRIIKKLHNDANITAIDDNWMNYPHFLQECDIVFGCVDSFAARRDLEAECRRYLIPLIDIGMDVYDGFEEEAPNMVGQIILSMPNKPCMHCMGFLNEKNLAKEAAKYGNVGGRPQVVWSNGLLASQAIGLFVDLLTGWTNKEEINLYYAFDGNKGILDYHPRVKYISNTCEHYKNQQVGIPIWRKI